MAKKERTVVEIDGDVSGLNKAIGQAEKKLDGFSQNVGGSVGGLAKDFSGGLGAVSGGLTGLASGIGLVVTATAGLVLKLNAAVRELNQLSTQSGVSVEELQKLQKAFYDTGLGIDKFADLNQDALDKLGDAVANGGSIADDLKSVGLSVKDYIKYMGDKDGGIKALINMYYDLQKAGASTAEVKFLMESVASDSSRLGEVLNRSANANDAWNVIQGQSVAVTNETAEAFKTFDKNLDATITTGQRFLYDWIKPTIDELNGLYDLMNKSWTETELVNMLKKGTKDFFLGGDGIIPDTLRSITGVDATEVPSQARTDMFAKQREEQQKKEAERSAKLKKEQEDRLSKLQEKREADEKKKEDDKAKKAQDSAIKSAQSAAKAKAAEAKKAADERIKAQRELDAQLADMTIGESDRQFAIFERQQNEITAKIKENGKVLKLSQKDLDSYLVKQREYAAYQRTEMTNQMIGYSDPNAQMKTNIGLLQSGSLNSTQKGFLADQRAQGLGDNPNQQNQINQNNQAMQLELQQNELLLKGHEDYEKRKAQITAKYASQAVAIQNQETTQLLQGMENSFGQIGDGMAAAFGESSAAAQAAFAVQKGVTISMTILKIQEALASALALGFPQNIPAYAQIAAMGMSIISTAKGTNAGQFHGGIDELPSSYDNKSFMLKAGERVVQPEANKKLTSFLDNQEKGGSSGDVNVNAPLYVYGSDDDKQFQEKLKKHQNSIVQAVRDSQRRNS